MIKGTIKQGEYFDSVTLMIVSKELNKVQGVIDSSVIMGTNENKSILKMAELYVPEFDQADDTDMLISIDAENETAHAEAIERLEVELDAVRNKTSETGDFAPKSFEGAIEIMPEANLSLISVAGKYAVQEAQKALNNGLHVMMFSDNVSVPDEINLKQQALEKGLLMMGPDCGTAIINGVPLAFANVTTKGKIGIVAASGTGLQEVSSIITNMGEGISQAIGTGGRDVKEDVGGIMFIEALKALNTDSETEVIVLVSKPPHASVLEKIGKEVQNITKPVVAIFIGADKATVEKSGAQVAGNLAEAAYMAVAAAKGETYNSSAYATDFSETAKIAASGNKGKYLRGLFSGGTLCDETQLLLKETVGYVYSNTPLNDDFQLNSIWQSQENTILDMGEDEFTAGRPHPMIDFSLRNKRIVEEAKDAETAIILLDVVLGFGSNLAPAEELVPAFSEAKRINPNVAIICSITGTDGDPQNRSQVKSELENAGAIVLANNAEASILCEKVLSLLG